MYIKVQIIKIGIKIGTVYENEGKYIDKNTEYNILNNSTNLKQS